MRLVSAKELLEDAARNRYAVGAFSAHTPEMVKGILEAAHEEQSPVIIQIGQRAYRNCGFSELVQYIRWYGAKVDIPVIIHLDHGKSFEQTVEAIQAGCTSVMYDGSHLSLDQNIEITRKVVEVARSVGIAVEAELGKIAGVEDDVSVDEKEAYLTDPVQAQFFYSETQVDALAVAIGSAHGMYKSEPKLDMERLSEIRRLINIPIVLHGGSGIPEEQIRRAIQHGISKINVDTELRTAYSEGVREALDKYGPSNDVYQYARCGSERMKQVVREKIRLFGSGGKA